MQHSHQTQHAKKGKIPKKRIKIKTDYIPNIPMKSTFQVFKNQLRPDLSKNKSTLKLPDSNSNLFSRTLFTNDSKLQNTSLNTIDVTKITAKQNKNYYIKKSPEESCGYSDSLNNY